MKIVDSIKRYGWLLVQVENERNGLSRNGHSALGVSYRKEAAELLDSIEKEIVKLEEYKWMYESLD